MSIDCRQLRVFHAVALTGSFTQAAKQLHVAQPAVSVTVRKLEAYLEVALFHRDERRAKLTDEGRVLFEHADKILHKLDDAELAIQELKGLTRGELRIGIPGMLGSYFFPPVLMGFKDRYPKIRLTIEEAGTRKIQALILSGELDIGVVVTPQVTDDLETQHLVAEEMVACLPKDHPLAKRHAISPEQLLAEDLVVFKPGTYQREFIETLGEQTGHPPRIAFETELITLSKALIRRGFGVGLFIRRVIGPDEDLVAVPLTVPASLNTSMAWRRDAYLTHAERAFLDFVTEQLTTSN